MKFIFGRADEPGDELVRGMVVELERRADLLDHAVAQDDDLVGEGHRLDLVVGDVDHGGVEPLVEPRELDAHLHAQRGVEVGERLVEQEDLRLAHDGAADGDALALAAGELPWACGRDSGSSWRRSRRLVDLGVALRLGHAGEAQREGHVVAHRHVRVERVGLEHHGEAALVGRHVVDPLAVDHQVARR